jgi:hypothetical protein
MHNKARQGAMRCSAGQCYHPQCEHDNEEGKEAKQHATSGKARKSACATAAALPSASTSTRESVLCSSAPVMLPGNRNVTWLRA